MDQTTQSCRAFVAALASAAPAPGGGGAAALVGAVGAALGSMVGALTIGKPKYAAVEAQIAALQARCDALQTELLDQVQADELGFLPLSKAYGIPMDDPARAEQIDCAAVDACAAPLRIMTLCGEALECIAELAANGSRLAVSDAACAAVCCKAALRAASLNVFINTKMLKNRDTAARLDRTADALLEKYDGMADQIYADVLSALRSGR